MRRPAPLPRAPEREEQPAPAPPSRLARFTRERPADTEAETLAASAVSESSATLSEPDAPAGDETLTVRDVWRAARARRKTLRAEIRRFTQRSRRRRLIWLGTLAAVLILIGGTAAAAYSPLFAVRKITVVGASALDPMAIEAALADQLGTPLALVDENDVKSALIAFPLIETYALEARPPNDLTLRIVERTPIGVVASDAGYTLVDAAGVALSTTPDAPAGQPVLNVVGGTESDAFESVGLVIRSLPADVRATVTEVSASTLDDVSLKLSTGLSVVWGSADDSVMKAETLSRVLIARPDARTVDVSSYLVPVVG